MIRKFAYLFFFITISITSFSQSEVAPASNAPNLFLELGGNGGILSLNYDMRFNKTGKGLGGRFGMGFVPGVDVVIASTSAVFMLPVGINYLFGNGPNHLEAGAGATYASGSFELFGSSEKADGVFFIPSIGYRFQPTGKGFTGRIFASPYFGNGTSFFWAGVSGGIKF